MNMSNREEIYKFALEHAFCILNSLYSNYLAEGNKGGILKHGCFHKSSNVAIDSSLIWGDYYFIEALVKTYEQKGVNIGEGGQLRG